MVAIGPDPAGKFVEVIWLEHLATQNTQLMPKNDDLKVVRALAGAGK